MAERVCIQCGSSDWFACAPGTADDARIYPYARPRKAAPEPPDDDGVVLPACTWCRSCWLLWRAAAAGYAHTTPAAGAP
jgi:hypothetical protein